MAVFEATTFCRFVETSLELLSVANEVFDWKTVDVLEVAKDMFDWETVEDFEVEVNDDDVAHFELLLLPPPPNADLKKRVTFDEAPTLGWDNFSSSKKLIFMLVNFYYLTI